MQERDLPELAEVLALNDAVRNGVLACCSLPAEEALPEILLVLSSGLHQTLRHREQLLTADGELAEVLSVLLTAEECWMNAMLDMLESSPGEDLRDRCAEALTF